MRLAESHVLLTGASSGIGRQLALDLLERGASVTSVERRAVETTSPRWKALQADIRIEDEVRAACASIDRPVDILINNAGVMRRASLLEHTVEEFDLLMDTHVRGAWLVLKYALPHLRPDATIVQMSSRHALGLPANPSLYGLTKRCVMDMMEIVAKTYPQFSIKVLCPGPVDTPLSREGETPEGLDRKRPMMRSPADISAHVIRLLESEADSRLMFDEQANAYFLD